MWSLNISLISSSKQQPIPWFYFTCILQDATFLQSACALSPGHYIFLNYLVLWNNVFFPYICITQNFKLSIRYSFAVFNTIDLGWTSYWVQTLISGGNEAFTWLKDTNTCLVNEVVPSKTRLQEKVFKASGLMKQTQQGLSQRGQLFLGTHWPLGHQGCSPVGDVHVPYEFAYKCMCYKVEKAYR